MNESMRVILILAVAITWLFTSLRLAYIQDDVDWVVCYCIITFAAVCAIHQLEDM